MTKTHPAVSIHKKWINPLLGLALAALAIALGGCGDSDVDSSKTRSLAKGIFGGPGHTYTQDFLISSDVQAGDRFGWFVRVAGNTMVVGAPQEDGGAGDPIFDVGAVYVLKKDGAGTWNEAQILRPSDGQISDSFGYVLDFDGQTIAIQSWFEDGGPGDPALDTGAVYLFEPDGSGNWIEKTILHASDMQPGDIFGGHLSVRGNTILVGSALEDGGSGDPLADSGAIYVFQRDGGGVWNETQILRSSEIQGGDFFPEWRFTAIRPSSAPGERMAVPGTRSLMPGRLMSSNGVGAASWKRRFCAPPIGNRETPWGVPLIFPPLET